MRKIPFAFLIATAVIATAAPAGAQSFIDKLNAKLDKWSGAARAPGAPSAMAAATTPTLSAAIDRLLVEPVDDPKIAADRVDAAALIRSLLVTGACNHDGQAWQAFNEQALEPHTFQSNYQSVMGGMQYHDQKACLDVVRVTNWQKPAANAISFDVYFVAADSGEAGHQGFELQKSSDGRWLVRAIGANF